MLAENTADAPMTTAARDADHRASFFRQSGWLMIANIGGGVFMWAVHLLNKFLPGGEYGSAPTNPDVQRANSIAASIQDRLVTAIESHVASLTERIGSVDTQLKKFTGVLDAMPA